MKQTVSILIALVAVVLLATGLIVADNIDLNQRIEQREEELLAAYEKISESQKQLQSRLEEVKTSAAALERTTAERDSLNQQLNEAVLASQAANETAEKQRQLNEQASFELETLKMEYRDLTKACDALEAQISLLNSEAVQSAAAYQQQSLSDAKRIAELEQQLSTTPVPEPLVPVRRTQRFVQY